MSDYKKARQIKAKLAARLSAPELHQLKIAKQTLRMTDAGANVLGGMTKGEARTFLVTRAGWTVDRVAQFEKII